MGLGDSRLDEPVIDSVAPGSAAEGAVVTIRGANFGPSVGAFRGPAE